MIATSGIPGYRVLILTLYCLYKWLFATLMQEATAAENRSVHPWIVLFGHRPMYCSNTGDDDCTHYGTYTRVGVPFLHWLVNDLKRTACNRVLEKLVVSQKRHYCVDKSMPLIPILRQINHVSFISTPVLSSHLFLHLNSGLFLPGVPPENFLCIYGLFYTCYVPSYFLPLDVITLLMFCEK